MNRYLVLVVAMLLVSTSLALAQVDGKPIIEETAQQKEERMLKAFNAENIVPGKIIFSFTEGTTQKEAEAILAKYDLKLTTQKICTETEKGTTCETVDSWLSSIYAGIVAVPEGKEKALAKQIVNAEKDVIWAEPDSLAELAGNGENQNPIEAPKSFLGKIFSPLINFFKELFS